MLSSDTRKIKIAQVLNPMTALEDDRQAISEQVAIIDLGPSFTKLVNGAVDATRADVINLLS